MIELTDAELLRYSRQILLQGWDIDAQLRLKNSAVYIVGAGGLGCPVSETLARAGVGLIHIIDDDKIELSNLQRQTLFTTKDIGEPKAQVAKHRLMQINEFTKVTCDVTHLSKHNIEHYLGAKISAHSATHIDEYHNHHSLSGDECTNFDVGAALLLDCTDNFVIRDLLNQFSVKHNIALLSASAIAMSGQLALFEPNKNTGCYHCVFGNEFAHELTNQQDNQLLKHQPLKHQPLKQSEGQINTLNRATKTNLTHSPNTMEKSNPDRSLANCLNSGVLASTTAIMGNLQANAALQYLGLNINPLQNDMLLWDGKRMMQRRLKYRADSDCPICGIRNLHA